MKKLINSVLVLGLLLLFANNVWALPVAGDLATMTSGDRYTLTTNNVSYQTFCVEKHNFFSYNSTYLIESVANYATGGGGGAVNGQDYIADETKWLYASFYDGSFGSKDENVETMVQNAIWLFEGEYLDDEANLALTAANNWLSLLGLAGITYGTNYDFTVTGWDIKVANLVDYTTDADGNYIAVSGSDRQSQLVGAPVPEPATMVLFGIGLLGLAGIGRKKTKQ